MSPEAAKILDVFRVRGLRSGAASSLRLPALYGGLA
jgi:hypothetical protein